VWLSYLLGAFGGPVWKDVGSTTLGNIVGALAGFVAGAVLAHWLGPGLRGTFELGLFVANSGLLLLSLGLNIPVSVFLAQQPAKGIWAYQIGLRWLLFLVLLGVGLFAASNRLLPESAGSTSYRPTALGTLVAFGSLFLAQLVSALLIGLGRIRRLNLSVVARWLLYLSGMLALSAAAPPDAETALAWFATSVLGGVIVALWGVRDVSRSADRSRLVVRSRVETLWFGVRGQLSNVFQFASYRFDVLLVGLWVGPAGLGVYAVGVLFAEALWLLPNAVGTVLLSHTSRSETSVSDRRLGVVFPVTMGMVILGAIALALAAPIAVHAYLGEGYAKVPLVTWLLLPGAVALSGSKILANELTARGFPGMNTVVAALGATATIASDILLIPRYGIAGAAIASSIGYTLTFVLVLFVFRRRSRAQLLSLWPRAAGPRSASSRAGH